MKTLPLTHKRRGYDCKQLARTDKWAIYDVRRTDGMLIGYEVFKVKVSKPRTFEGGRATEEGESYPGDNLFGRSAWFCKSIARCWQHVEKESERTALIAACSAYAWETAGRQSNTLPDTKPLVLGKEGKNA